MKMFLSICIALLALCFGTAQAMPRTLPTNSASYVVKKGDTLTAITAKEFSGATVADIAKANDITNPNLIYPGMILTYPAAEVNALTVVKQTTATMRERMPAHTTHREESPQTRRDATKATCDTALILERLFYPTAVRKQFEEIIGKHHEAKMGLPISANVTHDGINYHLLLEKDCIATKIVDTLRTIPSNITGDTDHVHENTAALTPQQRVDMTTTEITRANRNRDTHEELNTLLARIKKELQEIMGDDEDVTPLVIPLALAIIRKAETSEAAFIRLKK